jgi:hypothetical protein
MEYFQKLIFQLIGKSKRNRHTSIKIEPGGYNAPWQMYDEKMKSNQ